MKGKDAALVFEPSSDEGDAEEVDVEEAPPSSTGKADTLLGNAFDALQDGDREGFIASMKAARRAG